jgi:D-serine deaminase-like pyridoxal phosphate-dependent protein
VHQVSAGTVVYCDVRSLQQLPAGYAPGALVISRVISHPCKGIITCDAGHKTMGVDVGVPHCLVMGSPGPVPKPPSEEHLPLAIEPDSIPPRLESVVYLIPYHVCPTVNNFDQALFIGRAKIESVEKVCARGREMPVLS